MGEPCTLIFDIGKTNKKLFLFDMDLKEIHKEYADVKEIEDDDGFPCDDLQHIVSWIHEKVQWVATNPDYDLRALNFTTYGASLVNLNSEGRLASPFYNYLKPLPESLKDEFIDNHFPDEDFSLITSSPYLGMLNSGFQLFYLKNLKPDLFRNVATSLHFPQYLSYQFTNETTADFTSVGCHTGMWDFKSNKYAKWLSDEGIQDILPQVLPASTSSFRQIQGRNVRVGIGVHDSSAALHSHLIANEDPFVLISTGTWSICMNPFSGEGLTKGDLACDCLQFLKADGNPVKGSRLFLGKHFENRIRQLSSVYNVDEEYYKTIHPKNDLKIGTNPMLLKQDHELLNPERFGFSSDYDSGISYSSFEEEYFNFMDELTNIQIRSLMLSIGKSDLRKLVIDGGFGSNELFVKLLSLKLPQYEIESNEIRNGTAVGAAALVQS